MKGLQVEDETRGAGSDFDPEDADTPEVYKLPVALSAEQTQRLIVDIANMDKLIKLRNTLRGENNRMVEHFRESKELLSERVASKKGFKRPETSLRWAEVTGVTPGKLTVFLGNSGDLDDFGYFYRERVKAIKGRILAGRILAGDLRYIAMKQSQVLRMLRDNETALRATAELRDWFLDDALFDTTTNPRLNAESRERVRGLEIDKWKSLQDAVDAIFQGRVDGAATQPSGPPSR